MYNLYISEKLKQKDKARLISQSKSIKEKQKHKEDIDKRYIQYQHRVIEFLKSKHNPNYNKDKALDDNPLSKEEVNCQQIERMLMQLSTEVKPNSNQPMRFTARSNVERILESSNIPPRESRKLIKKHLQLLKLSHSIGKTDSNGVNNQYIGSSNDNKESNDDYYNKPYQATTILPTINRHELMKFINKDAKKIKPTYHNKTYFKGIQTIADSYSTKNIHNCSTHSNKLITPTITTITTMSNKDILDEMREYNDYDNNGPIMRRYNTQAKIIPQTNIRLDSLRTNIPNKKKEVFRKTIMNELSKLAFINDNTHYVKESSSIEMLNSNGSKPRLEDLAIDILEKYNIYHKKIQFNGSKLHINHHNNNKDSRSKGKDIIMTKKPMTKPIHLFI